jgi:hypothetical protein
MYRFKLTMVSGAFQEYDATPTTGTNTAHNFQVPTSEEFTGFTVYGDSATDCIISGFIGRTRGCRVNFDLSLIDKHG